MFSLLAIISTYCTKDFPIWLIRGYILGFLEPQHKTSFMGSSTATNIVSQIDEFWVYFHTSEKARVWSFTLPSVVCSLHIPVVGSLACCEIKNWRHIYSTYCWKPKVDRIGHGFFHCFWHYVHDSARFNYSFNTKIYGYVMPFIREYSFVMFFEGKKRRINSINQYIFGTVGCNK